MIAKNNPFNIRSANYTWLGQDGQSKGFCTFREVQYGVRAFFKLMHTYRRNYGCYRVFDIVYRFAPPSENNTKQYVAFVAKAFQGNEMHYLKDGTDYDLLAQKVAQFETGSRFSLDYLRDVRMRFNVNPVSVL